ncbi:maltose acetyltransferase [Elsinoe australis]|uniref:Maltose acetyltransferase n=1 Tax=Elsinoe australis TaxID=40998 RepID=A0A4U7ASS4_9PEZI|nr:maltose acetyltransferase [Elsinoe australis]
MAATHKNPDELGKARELNHIPWCEEYEKMISGMLYDSFTSELNAARFKARKWCHNYNTTFPDVSNFEDLAQARGAMLKEILGSIADEEAFIEPPFVVDYGCNLKLGKRFYANFNFTVLDCGIVTIGDRVMLGPHVSIFAATHEVEVESRRQNIEYTKPVTIGDDVWIGGHTVILPGVTIGEGCTVAASSVVTKDVPPWSVVMGSPARVVKKVPRAPQEESRALQAEGS